MFFAVFVGFDKLAVISQKSPSPAPNSARISAAGAAKKAVSLFCIFAEYLDIIFRLFSSPFSPLLRKKCLLLCS